MKPDGTRPEADHRLRVDELGAVHASVGRVHHLRVEQAGLRELRGVHGGRAGTKEPVRVTYSDGFDGLPVPSPDGTQTGVDVEPRAAAAPGRSSWRSGITRRRSRRSAARRRGRSQGAMTNMTTSRVRRDSRLAVVIAVVRPRRRPGGRASARPAGGDAQHARRTSRRSRPTALEGRLAGSAGERLAARLHRARAAEDGREAAARAEGLSALPSTSRPARKDGGSTLSSRAAARRRRSGVPSSRRRAGAGALLLRQRRGERPGGVRRLRHRRAGEPELRLRQLRRRST